MAAQGGHAIRIPFQIVQADLVANNPFEFTAPADGFIDNMDLIVQAAVTTGGTVTVKNYRADLAAGVGTVVPGLTKTIPNAAAKGSKPTAGAVATRGRDERRVKAGDRIELVFTGFATAGALNGHLVITELDAGGQAL